MLCSDAQNDMSQLIIPALADLSQDIAGNVPLDLIQTWLTSARDEDAHERILAPYVRVGTISCTDSAGLSKLSSQRPLVEVMKFVSEPKEVIYAHGRAIGGRGIGTWVADNTQMFYDASIPVDAVVRQMIAAQRAMRNFTVKVGFGIHQGSAYEIGGGLYGAEADDIEQFAEDETRGGEIGVSKKVRDALNAQFITKEERLGKILLDVDAGDVVPQTSNEWQYPVPFPRTFHESLRALDVSKPELVEALHRAHAKETTIILVRLFHAPQPLLLDTFAAKITANACLFRAANKFEARIIKSDGSLAILAATDPREAVRCAHTLHDELRSNGYIVNIGLCKGEVLLFDLDDGGSDLAGGPVNVASKLVEDTKDRNILVFEESVQHEANEHRATEPFTITKSGVEIKGVRRKDWETITY